MQSIASNQRTSQTALLFTVGAMLAAFALSACSKSPEQAGANARGAGHDSPAVAVRLAPISRRSVQRGIEVTGTFFGDDEAAISARVRGPIVAVYKDLGDRVAAGEVLAEIDRTEYELARQQSDAALREALARLGLDVLPTGDFDFATLPAVQRAQAEENNARARYQRGRALFDDDPPLISEQELENLATALEVATREVTVQKLAGRALLSVARTRNAELAIAEQAVRDTEIRAPLAAALGTASAASNASPQPDGRAYAVASRLISLGEYVTEGSIAFRIVDGDPVKYRIAAPERFLGAVQVGQRVAVRVEAFEGEFAGIVARISPRVDPESRTFEIEAEIPNHNLRLKPGAFAVGRIETHVDEGVLFAPESAVSSFAGIKRLYTVHDGKAREHRIQTGPVIDGEVEIIGGDLSPDSSIVIEGAARLAPGAAVTVERLERVRLRSSAAPLAQSGYANVSVQRGLWKWAILDSNQ